MTVKEHLDSRYLDITLHKVWLCEELACATLPLYNLHGILVGYQRYRPYGSKSLNNDPREGKYFTRVLEGKVAVWGLESWNLSNTLFLTEGVFDACRLTHLGYSAIAVLSSNLSKSTKEWLYCVRANRKVVAVCDNDKAGKMLSKYGNEHHTVTSYKDLGEASNDYVKNLAELYAS